MFGGGQKKCKVGICDVGLVKEYCGTCEEYSKLIRRPFSPIAPADLLKCDQADWEASFREWGHVQFFWMCFTAIVSVICFVAHDLVHHNDYGAYRYGGGAIFGVCYQVFMAYFVAHAGWFGAVKKHGCCVIFCIVCISDAEVLLLLWGVLCLFWGLCTISGAFWLLAHFSVVAFIICCFNVVHGIILLYMGNSCIRLWQQLGEKWIPQAAEVTYMNQVDELKDLGKDLTGAAVAIANAAPALPKATGKEEKPKPVVTYAAPAAPAKTEAKTEEKTEAKLWTPLSDAMSALTGPTVFAADEVAAISLHIHGINLEQMTPKQRSDLSKSAVADQAALAGVPAKQIRDLEGRPASVTLEAGSVKVLSHVEVPPGSTVASVTGALSSAAAKEKIVASAAAVPGIEKATNGTISVDASVKAIKAADVAEPKSGGASGAAKSVASKTAAAVSKTTATAKNAVARAGKERDNSPDADTLGKTKLDDVAIEVESAPRSGAWCC